MKYLDTVYEKKERINKARENLNIVILLVFIGFAVSGLIGFGFVRINYLITGLYFECTAVMYLVLGVGLIIKREIFSIAIILKNIGDN